MAFDQLRAEIEMLFSEMENQPQDKWQLHENIREKLLQLKSFGLPLPQDLIDLEAQLDRELAVENETG